MTLPEEEVAAPYAFRVLAAVAEHPGQTTDFLKHKLGVVTQSVSARLSDLVDFGLVRDDTHGNVVRGNHVSPAKTYHLTERGERLLAFDKVAPEVLAMAFSAHRAVQMERARAMADQKREWREKAATAAQEAILSTMEGLDLI